MCFLLQKPSLQPWTTASSSSSSSSSSHTLSILSSLLSSSSYRQANFVESAQKHAL